MTNPFTAFAFAATGEPTARTLPDRLADIKNVKDFGATGNGVTDDWAAIMAAVNWTTSGNRGLIYFPPGTYSVSQPINFLDGGVAHEIVNIIFRGEIGLSSVVGNFADYVFRRAILDSAGDGGVHAFEGLTVANTNATGGGIRIGFCVGAAVRDCIVTANLGINTASDDVMVGVTSQEVSIENCTLSPGAHASGSLGIMSVSDGPIVNCNIVGFSKGIIGWGNQGCQNVIGCHIELCGTGVNSGDSPVGSPGNTSMRIAGCHFKNCGTAIAGGGSMRIVGVYIEGATGTIAGDPQYGINGNFGSCLFGGIVVTGTFQQYGIALAAGVAARNLSTFIGVKSTNAGGLGNWNVGSPAGSQFIGCNYAPVTIMANLPAFIVGNNTFSWSAGTTTLNLFFNIGPFTGSPMTITVEGATPSGYNGTFTATGVSGNNVTYSQSNPGSPTGSGGNAVINYQNNALEGDSFNVSDSDVSTWGGNPVGGGSTHAKVRWNGTNWSVGGK